MIKYDRKYSLFCHNCGELNPNYSRFSAKECNFCANRTFFNNQITIIAHNIYPEFWIKWWRSNEM
jgi:hypothetical protein